MEKKFLAYLLYVTLLEMREWGYENKNSRIYHLCDLLHNVPGQLLSEQEAKEGFQYILERVNDLNIPEWLTVRKEEFISRFPEYYGRI
jgi:hypothetical protein